MSQNTRSNTKKYTNNELMEVMLDIKKHIKKQDKKLDELKEKLKSFKSEVRTLRAENGELKSAINQIMLQQNRNSVIIHGVPIKETDQETADIVVKGLNTIEKLDNSVSEIRRLYKNKKPTKQVEVKFRTYTDKQKIITKYIHNIKSKTPLTASIFDNSDNNKIYINNHLSYSNHQIMKKATEMKYKNIINKVWIQKNQIFIKKSFNSTPKKIADISELHQIEQPKDITEEDDDDETFNSAEDSE